MKKNYMSESVNWLQIEAENKDLFSKFKSFLNKKSINLENATKEIFNQFISESNYPTFLIIPEQYNFNDDNVKTTFRGIHSFTQLTLKK